ncbi:MAG TPA: hypothetical protein VFK54_12325, partial [Candidatus Limnocylindrales bacterium]|nr:hypothetical protein [Candidatus Limnocylindrales bacterium]
APEPVADADHGVAVAAPTDPAPPVEPAPEATIGRHGTLAIVAPESGARMTSRSLVVIGVAPSGAEVVLDGPLFLDRTVAADPWGAWSMPLTLDPGRHDLVFALAGTNATPRTLSLEIAATATATVPTVVWPPEGTALDADRATLRGTAAPGARVAVSSDDPLGAIGVALGTAGATEADAAGRWTLPVDLAAGPNRFRIVSDDHAIRHTLIRDDGAGLPTGVAPELAVRSVRTLTFDASGPGALVQVVVEVENTSGGWLDLLGGAPPTAAVTTATATGPAAALLPFPRRVAPGHTALLLGELRSAQLDDAGAPRTADDLVLAIDAGYTTAATPAQRGRVETYQLEPRPGVGLSVTGRFRGGSIEPRFRVAVLGYDAGGSLIAFATSAPARPGSYDACCLPLFGVDARSDLARVVGLVTGG